MVNYPNNLNDIYDIYSGPCILRSPIQPRKRGLKFEVVWKWKEYLN